MTERRALVVRGGWSGHAPVEATELFLPFLKDSGFDILVTETLEVYADADLMAETDLILQCWTMGEILPAELLGLRKAVSDGTGLAGWHGGIIDSFRNSPDYLQLIGGQFAAHAHDIVDHTVEVEPQHVDHPLVAGIEFPLELRSEQYWVLSDDANEVLATTTIPPREEDAWHEPIVSPAVWTRQWGQGRIFVCAEGHRPADLEVPAIRSIIERGLLWAAR